MLSDRLKHYFTHGVFLHMDFLMEKEHKNLASMGSGLSVGLQNC